MKKSLILLPAILLLIFVLLSALDQSDYPLEKKTWTIQRSIPNKNLGYLINEYKVLISKHPKSRLIVQMYLNMGGIYAAKGDYNTARSYYFEIIKRWGSIKLINAVAYLEIGTTYERENRKSEAIRIYKQIIIENYNPTITHLAKLLLNRIK